MYAKEEPRYAGILLLVSKRKMIVPIPEERRATAGLKPVRNGTKTVAPNIAKTCCKPSGIAWARGSFSWI